MAQYLLVVLKYDWIKRVVDNTCPEDSPLAFRLTLKNKKKRFIKCTWIQEKEERMNYYCARGKVKAMCPSTCDRCDICKDYEFMFKIKNEKGKTVSKTCAWFSDNKKNRCEKFEGVSDTCRESCGSC